MINRNSRYLAVILAVFVLAGAVSGPAFTAYASETELSLAVEEDPVLADESEPALEAGAEAGEQEVFTITYTANGGGYFVDHSGSDEQYAAFSEEIKAGTVICGRHYTADFSEMEDSFEVEDSFEIEEIEGGERAGAVYSTGTAVLYANDGNEFLGWSLQEDGAEMISDEGIRADSDVTVYAVWKQETSDEDDDSGELTETGTEADTDTITEAGTDTEAESGSGSETEINAETETGMEAGTGSSGEGVSGEGVSSEDFSGEGISDEGFSGEDFSGEGTSDEGFSGEDFSEEALQDVNFEAGESADASDGESAENEDGMITGEEDLEETVGSAVVDQEEEPAAAQEEMEFSESANDQTEDSQDALTSDGTGILSDDGEGEDVQSPAASDGQAVDVGYAAGAGENGSESGNQGGSESGNENGNQGEGAGGNESGSGSEGSGSPVDSPQEYTVTFDANGGSFSRGESTVTDTVREGKTIRTGSYDEPEKEGCRFKGWSLERDSESPGTVRRLKVMEDVTLYAVWAEYRTITFNANGGFYGRRRLAERTESFEAGERIDLNDYKPGQTGWGKFKGWSLSGKDTDLLPDRYTVTDNVTLYAVWARNVKNAEVKLSSQSYTYNGKARTPAVTVYYENRILKQGTDYTVSYSNNIKAGKATVTITGTGSYEGTARRKFTINKAAQKLTLTTAASSVSVGKTVKIKAAGAKETNKYTYKSSDRSLASVSSSGVVTAKKVGKVRITVSTSETDNYKKGTCSVLIKIVPGATKKLTAVNRKKGIKIKWKKVSGATGYLLYRDGKKIATIKKGSTVSYLDKKASVKGKKYKYKLVAKASTGESTLARTVSIVRSLTSKKSASSSGDPQSTGSSSPASSTSGSSGSSSSGSSGSGSSGSESSGTGSSGTGSSGSGSSEQPGSASGLPLMNTRYCLERDSVQSALKKCGENDFIVIDFDGISQSVINGALNRGVQIYGYLNAGALEQDRSYYSRYSSLRLAKYDGWAGEYWVDVTNQTWKEHLVEEAEKLKAAGASGIYFDNADILYMVESGFREEKTTMLRTAPSSGKVYQALSDVILTIENTVGITVMPNGGDIFVRRFVSEFPGAITEVNQEGVLYDGNRQQPADECNYLTDYLDWCKNRGLYIRGIEYINTTAGASAAKAYYAEHNWDTLYISRQKNLLGN